jgi:hypothetical protein
MVKKQSRERTGGKNRFIPQDIEPVNGGEEDRAESMEQGGSDGEEQETGRVFEAAVNNVGDAVAPEGYEIVPTHPAECSIQYVPAGTSILFSFTGPPLRTNDLGWYQGEVHLARSAFLMRRDSSTNFWVTFRRSETNGVIPVRFAERAGFVAGAELDLELGLEIENYGRQWVVLREGSGLTSHDGSTQIPNTVLTE